MTFADDYDFQVEAEFQPAKLDRIRVDMSPETAVCIAEQLRHVMTNTTARRFGNAIHAALTDAEKRAGGVAGSVRRSRRDLPDHDLWRAEGPG